MAHVKRVTFVNVLTCVPDLGVGGETCDLCMLVTGYCYMYFSYITYTGRAVIRGKGILIIY